MCESFEESLSPSINGSINLSSELTSLISHNVNLSDEVSPTSSQSFYPPIMIPAPQLMRTSKTPRSHPKSSPVLSEVDSVGDIFFDFFEEVDEGRKISWHQRKRSRFQDSGSTEDGCSMGGNANESGSPAKAISDCPMKKQTNPWKNAKHQQEPLPLGTELCYDNLVSSPLVPKVIPVQERVEMIVQEFVPWLSWRAVPSQLYWIKSKVQELMIHGIERRAIEQLSQTRTDGKQLLKEALTSVITDLIEKSTELQSYGEEGINTFIGNMAFIGDMAKLNLVDKWSILSALSHLCRQHQREQHPAYIIGAKAIVLKSDIDLNATVIGLVIHEYIFRPNPNRIQFAEDGLFEQHSELWKDGTNYSTDESFATDGFEPSQEYDFYDLY